MEVEVVTTRAYLMKSILFLFIYRQFRLPRAKHHTLLLRLHNFLVQNNLVKVQRAVCLLSSFHHIPQFLPSLPLFMRLPTAFLRRLYTTSTSSSTSSPKQSLIKTYLSTLRSKYPQADAPSLIASFLILHELTAIVPLFLGFWGLKTLGVGEELSNWVKTTELSIGGEGGEGGKRWGKQKVGEWIVEGEKQAGLIGRRYGTFGFEKESKEDRGERKRLEKEAQARGDLVLAGVGDGSVKIAGDVANLVVAYIAVKVGFALLLFLFFALSHLPLLFAVGYSTT